MRIIVSKWALLFLMIGACNQSFAQKADTTAGLPVLNLTWMKTIQGQFTDHCTDHIQQAYAFTVSGQLKKYHLNDSSIFLYNDLRKFGKPTTIDVSNPLHNVVFFKSSLTIVILDRLMTCRNSISLRKNDFFNVGCAANAYDNNIWIFDSRNLKLVKIDEYGKVLLESSELSNLAEILPQHPDKLFEYKQMVCLVDGSRSIYLFDRYGSYQKNISIDQMEVVGTCPVGILLRKGNKVKLWDPEKPINITSYVLPANVSGFSNIKINNEILSVLTNAGIDVYLIK